jgi:hypothetical protein
MTHTYAILEKPVDDAGRRRAAYFMEAFGALRVPLVDDEVVLFQAPGEKVGKLRYKAAVYSAPLLELRFETSCLMRPGGDGVLAVARACGFYPVNVDGIIVVRSERPLFGPNPECQPPS